MCITNAYNDILADKKQLQMLFIKNEFFIFALK